MEILMDEVCGYLHNYFVNKHVGIRRGKFTIENGSIELPLLDGQYFRVKGSVFNDGVWRYPADDMADETFTGEVWAMSVPPALIALLPEIEAWDEKYGGADSVNYSPYASESFNNYSYSKRSSGNANSMNSSDTPMTWKDAYAPRLRRWRKLNDFI